MEGVAYTATKEHVDLATAYASLIPETASITIRTQEACKELNQMRRNVKHALDEKGEILSSRESTRATLTKYLSQLTVPPLSTHKANIKVKWTDSIRYTRRSFKDTSGVLERCNVVFNIGAASAGMAIQTFAHVKRQDRLPTAKKHFEEAAGAFLEVKRLMEEEGAKVFSDDSAVNMEIRPAALEAFVSAMLAYAVRCYYEKALENAADKAAQAAQTLSEAKQAETHRASSGVLAKLAHKVSVSYEAAASRMKDAMGRKQGLETLLGGWQLYMQHEGTYFRAQARIQAATACELDRPAVKMAHLQEAGNLLETVQKAWMMPANKLSGAGVMLKTHRPNLLNQINELQHDRQVLERDMKALIWGVQQPVNPSSVPLPEPLAPKVVPKPFLEAFPSEGDVLFAGVVFDEGKVRWAPAGAADEEESEDDTEEPGTAGEGRAEQAGKEPISALPPQSQPAGSPKDKCPTREDEPPSKASQAKATSPEVDRETKPSIPSDVLDDSPESPRSDKVSIAVATASNGDVAAKQALATNQSQPPVAPGSKPLKVGEVVAEGYVFGGFVTHAGKELPFYVCVASNETVWELPSTNNGGADNQRPTQEDKKRTQDSSEIKEGTECWYCDRVEGVVKVQVEKVYRAHQPFSYTIKIGKRFKETERDRLFLQRPADTEWKEEGEQKKGSDDEQKQGRDDEEPVGEPLAAKGCAQQAASVRVQEGGGCPAQASSVSKVPMQMSPPSSHRAPSKVAKEDGKQGSLKVGDVAAPGYLFGGYHPDSGLPFYHCLATKEAVWELPSADHLAAVMRIQVQNKGAQLTPGCKVAPGYLFGGYHVGLPFYVNEKTRDAVWELPQQIASQNEATAASEDYRTKSQEILDHELAKRQQEDEDRKFALSLQRERSDIPEEEATQRKSQELEDRKLALNLQRERSGIPDEEATQRKSQELEDRKLALKLQQESAADRERNEGSELAGDEDTSLESVELSELKRFSQEKAGQELALKLLLEDIEKQMQKGKAESATPGNDEEALRKEEEAREKEKKLEELMTEKKELERKLRQLEEAKKAADEEPPDNFLCPITFAIMEDPVLAMDGHSYERHAIEDWLKRNNTSPKTNVPLISKQLLPNHNLKSMILDWKEERAKG